ncbi:TPA: hypothetical protein ACIJXH_004492 [Escherichia coli]|nr:hypothetical protein [Salmonella enterica]EJQ2780282.1 hypothetical protein [Salmonella enterica]ELZ5336331.1 hypothetical protein [Escherichia coli]HBD2385665.1 hypothetical protein [Escherichia coli]
MTDVLYTSLTGWQLKPFQHVVVFYGPDYFAGLNVYQLGQYINVDPHITTYQTELTSAAMRLGQPLTAAKQVLQPLTVKLI